MNLYIKKKNFTVKIIILIDKIEFKKDFLF